jgi:DNA-directed RNA polymerase subunit F
MNVKKIMLNKKIVVSLFALVLFAACGGKDKEEGKEELVEVPDTIKTAVVNLGGELFSVPSPIQTALLIQKIGIAYDKSVLHTSKKVNTYGTDYARALNLGIYGADLAYVSLYNQTQDALGYLTALKQLADKLGVSSAFDAATMKRIEGNLTNKDSMLVLVGAAYRSSDAFLKNNRRNDVSCLILTGGWIESMHFSLSAYKLKTNSELKSRVAEQKQALNSLIKILSAYEGEEMKTLTTMLTDLAKIYEGVEFRYNFVEPTHDSEKKLTYINSTTEVIISDDQIKQISDKVSEIRNKIVNSTNS